MGPQESRISYISPSQLASKTSKAESTNALTREVRQHRDKIDSLLRELEHHTHPKALARQAITWVRSSGNRTGVKDKAADVGGSLKHKAADATESLKESGREVGRKVSERWVHFTEGTKTSSREVLGKSKTQTQEGLRHVREGVVREMDENPFLVALGCLGAGVIAGLAFPSTRAEKQVASQVRESVRGTVRDVSESKSAYMGQAPFCDISA